MDEHLGRNSDSEEALPVEPFLKWPGGKRSLLQQLTKSFPSQSEQSTYFEPFLGGGAVFFSLRPRHAVLSDINSDLIEVYQAVRDEVDAVICHLSKMKYDEITYYKVRKSNPRSRAKRAARFIYLNKSCFNGIYRVNSKGKFNVPFGKHGKNVLLCDENQLSSASAALKDVEIVCLDFEHSLLRCRAGDFVYVDPPYTTAHKNNGFLEYNAKIFSWEDQERLARVVHRLANEGVKVVISNADHPTIVEQYQALGNFSIKTISRQSTVAGSAKQRSTTTELVIASE